MESLVQGLIYYIDIWGYTAIFLGTLLASACIPLPSEIILGFGGYLVYISRLNFEYTIAVGIIGELLGSLISYSIGFYGGPTVVDRYGKYIFLSHKKMSMAQQWFEQYGIIVVFVGRLLPVIRGVIALPAGFGQVNFKKFVVFIFFSSAVWATVLVYTGIKLGENWRLISSYGHAVAVGATVILIIAAVIFYVFKVQKQQGNNS